MTQLPPEKSLPEALADALAATRAAVPPDPLCSTDIPALQKSLLTISAISEGRLSEIVALTDILLDWLKIPASARKLEELAEVLNVIGERAESMRESVYSFADEVGCWTPGLDSDRQERIAAFRKALTVGS